MGKFLNLDLSLEKSEWFGESTDFTDSHRRFTSYTNCLWILSINSQLSA